MFIIKKLSKKGVAGAAILLFFLLLLIMRFTAFNFAPTTAYCDTVGKYSLEITQSFSVQDFLNQFGLEIDKSTEEKVNIKIPSEFNAVYNRYNALQKQQGLNLEYSKGCKAVRYTYDVLNYPTGAEVKANVIVSGGRVIAGDLCTPQLNGVMTTLDDKSIEKQN